MYVKYTIKCISVIHGHDFIVLTGKEFFPQSEFPVVQTQHIYFTKPMGHFCWRGWFGGNWTSMASW